MKNTLDKIKPPSLLILYIFLFITITLNTDYKLISRDFFTQGDKTGGTITLVTSLSGVQLTLKDVLITNARHLRHLARTPCLYFPEALEKMQIIDILKKLLAKARVVYVDEVKILTVVSTYLLPF